MQNPTRRRVLAAGLTGTVLGLIGGRAASAGTTPPSDDPTGSAPAAEEPTSTELPQRPTEADIELLGFAQSVELTAQDLYQVSLDAGVEDDIITLMRDNHRAYAQVVAGILGVDAPGRRDESLYAELSRSFEETRLRELAVTGYDLESTLVATHTVLVGLLEGIDGARLIASIITVEAQQSTVLADMAGNGEDLDVLFVNGAEPLSLTGAGEG